MAPRFLRSAGAGKSPLDLAIARCQPLNIEAAVYRRNALDAMRH
jgi:hypothetical protein